jgi:hypothetical protein
LTLNLIVAWAAILTGLVSGTAIGWFFHDERWLGGYGSWSRRLVRLGHVAFFGTGLLNLAFAWTTKVFPMGSFAEIPSVLFVVGAVAMPAVCFLVAWRKAFFPLFVIPVIALTGGAAITLWLVISG